VDDDLKGRLSKYLDALERGAQKAGEFAEAEIPATIREWLIWQACESGVIALGFLIAAVVAYLLCTKGLRAAKNAPMMHQMDRDPLIALAWAGRVLIPAALLIGFVYNGLHTVKCIVAPRVVVVEKAAELVKGKK